MLMVQNMESCDKLKDGSLQSVAYASWIDCSNPNICRMTFWRSISRKLFLWNVWTTRLDVLWSLR